MIKSMNCLMGRQEKMQHADAEAQNRKFWLGEFRFGDAKFSHDQSYFEVRNFHLIANKTYPLAKIKEKLGTNGEAIFTFTPTQTGTYMVINNTGFSHQQGMYYSEIYE